MYTTSTTEHPEDVIETKIISESSVDDFDSNCHQWPTISAHISPRAAVSDIIIVCHIYIKYQLSFHRSEDIITSLCIGMPLRWINTVNRPNIYFEGAFLLDSSFKF
uniref:Uncharacterized protein n=1 Tax=Opuntia streptacantha TaxID=393608 RepID=A0A7C8ZB10_OPUST